MGARHDLGGGMERIKEEMTLLKLPPPPLIMPRQGILPGDSDLSVRVSAFSGYGTVHKGP